MNKDAILATLIGFGIGLLITGILLIGPNVAKSFPKISFPTITFPKINPPTKQTVTPTPTPVQADLTIDSPLADAIIDSNELLVSGSTKPKAIIIVQGEIDETITTANDDGKYASKVSLTEGKNDIIVTSYKDNKQFSQTVTVFYTPEKW